MTRTSLLLSIAFGGVLLCGNRPPDGRELDLSQLATIGAAELANQRGGFTFGGMTIHFGAEIRTYLDDELVLQTNVSYGPSGATTEQMASGALTPVNADQLRHGILSTGAMTINVGNSQVFLANEGRTALIHRTENGVQSILLNTASNISGRQELDAALELDGYESFRGEAMEARIMSQIGAMIAIATGQIGA
jgi:hypothetical protein